MREVETVMAEMRGCGEKLEQEREKYRAVFENGAERRKEIFQKLSGEKLETELDFLYAAEKAATENLGKSFVVFSEELADCLQKM